MFLLKWRKNGYFLSENKSITFQHDTIKTLSAKKHILHLLSLFGSARKHRPHLTEGVRDEIMKWVSSKGERERERKDGGSFLDQISWHYQSHMQD